MPWFKRKRQETTGPTNAHAVSVRLDRIADRLEAVTSELEDRLADLREQRDEEEK